MKKTFLSIVFICLIAGVNAQWSQDAGNIYPSTLSKNVGIGTSSPSSPLDVFKDYMPANTIGAINKIASFSIKAGINNTGIFSFLYKRHTLGDNDWANIGSRLQYVTDITPQGYIEFNPQSDAYGMAIGSNAGEIMRFKQNGNVGIGITNPAAKLEVNGNTILGSSTGASSVIINDVPGARYAINTGNHHLTFSQHNSSTNTFVPRLIIANGGNIGIGTTNPGSYKLAVEGKIGAREVKVTLENPWADYVFSENYNLVDLKALEAYIKKNNHLPGIPSANEVKENGGIDLGEMNRKLLEKVEELTLYIIDLKKENNQIKETVEELKERLK